MKEEKKEKNPRECKLRISTLSATILKEYVTRLEAGEDVRTDEYLREYPDLSDELRPLFDSLSATPQVDRNRTEEQDTAMQRLGGHESLSDFRIIRKIGSGGMATVYEADQLSLGRRVALKILPPHLRSSDVAVQKFYREAAAGGRQSHPGIVSVYSVGHEGDTHYIAMELVGKGRTVANWISENRTQRKSQSTYFKNCARLIGLVADALSQTHASGVIHRDVKPSNILLDENDRPKVSDFGLARVEDALALSRTGDFAGTLYYMSPEQVKGKSRDIDHRTDQYSLAVTLYEMLTFSLPFRGTPQEVLKEIVYHDPTEPRKLNPAVPSDLSVICMKALEKEPARRYENMADFAADLRRFLDNEVIEAKPSGFSTRVWKKVRRNPVLSVTAGVAMAAVVALMIFVPYYMINLADQRDRALASEKLEQETRVEAEKQRAMAEDSNANSAAISTFLSSMFDYIDPNRDGRNALFMDVFDKAVANVDRTIPKPSKIKAELESKIGAIYRELGYYENANEHLEASLALYQEVLGKDHEASLILMVNLALAWCEFGRLERAETHARQAVELVQRAFADSSLYTLCANKALARVFAAKGQYDEAESKLRKILEECTPALTKDNLHIQDTMNELALVLWRKAEYPESEALFEEMIETRSRLLGEDHTTTLSLMNNLANLYVSQGKYADAEKVHRHVYEIVKTKLGMNHPETWSTMDNLGIVLRDKGELEAAEAMHRKVLELSVKNLGEESPDTLTTMELLTNVLVEQGKYEEAETLGRRSLSIRRKVLGDEHPDTLKSLNSLAVTIRMQGRLPEAEKIERESLEGYANAHLENLPDAVTTKLNLADLLTDMNRLKEAETLFEKMLRLVDKRMPENHKTRWQCRVCYGKCLILLERFDESEKLLLEGYAGCRATMGDKSTMTRVALRNIIHLYEAWGKQDEASRYKELDL